MLKYENRNDRYIQERNTRKLKGLYVLREDCLDLIYGTEEQAEIERHIDIYTSIQSMEMVKANPAVLEDADVIFSGWGAPVFDERLLAHAPNLKAVFYGAGSIKNIVTEAFWERGILITSAYAANAIPVAEYTLSQILFCIKRGWYFTSSVKKDCGYPAEKYAPGVYGSTVGIISLGAVGSYVCKLLKAFDVKVIAYDPYITKETALSLNVELCELDEIFKISDVVSLHTPLLDETVNMITGSHFTSMKPYASFINTSRGAIICENEMIDALKKRTDLQVVLDVTWPEPLEHDSLLYSLQNVTVTPHIAGSLNNECKRMGKYMVDELKRFIAGKPLQWAISSERSAIMA